MYEHDNENNKNNAKQIDKESFNSTLVATGTFSGLEILNRDEKLIKNFCEELEKKLGKPLHYVGDDGKIKMIELRESLIDDAIKIFVGNNPESSLHIYFDIGAAILRHPVSRLPPTIQMLFYLPLLHLPFLPLHI